MPETLDQLAAEDRQAQRSRRDLRRVNAFMGNCGMLVRALKRWRAPGRRTPLCLLELGAGDGSLMLRVARRLAPSWPGVQLQLLDRLPLLDAPTRDAYRQLGWVAEPLICDVLEWSRTDARYDLIVTNLFLHHFPPEPLRQLLGAIAARCEYFVACEPRRSSLAVLGSHLVALLGANAVTRNDAVLSVHAGFRDHELSALWPGDGWGLHEGAAGLFSHLFTASRPSRSDVV
jgi:hypothetical protein